VPKLDRRSTRHYHRQRILLKMAKKGKFITFEGGEGCGKSTQVELLAQRLRKQGYQFTLLREPGGTDVGEQIRHVLLFGWQKEAMQPETELLLFCASRAQLVRERIMPELRRGYHVICDRFFDSTKVYQGVGRNLDPEVVSRINHFAISSCVPDLTIVVDLDPRVGMLRARNSIRPRIVRGDLFDHMETRSMEFFDRVRQGFVDLAKEEPKRVKVVDGDQPPELIQMKVWDIVSHVL
jgi:dTMP kinase